MYICNGLTPQMLSEYFFMETHKNIKLKQYKENNPFYTIYHLYIINTKHLYNSNNCLNYRKCLL